MAVQPLGDMSTEAYFARRARWLRVRKWTVPAATLVEPGTESALCCLSLSFAATTIPAIAARLGIPQTWSGMAAVWFVSMAAWMLVDRVLYGSLLRMRCIDVDEDTPPFARGIARMGGVRPRPFLAWLPAWLAREALALPIWTWAVLCGTTVTWRDRSFRVCPDMSTVELRIADEPAQTQPISDLSKRSHTHAHHNLHHGHSTVVRRSSSKNRVD